LRRADLFTVQLLVEVGREQSLLSKEHSPAPNSTRTDEDNLNPVSPQRSDLFNKRAHPNQREAPICGRDHGSACFDHDSLGT